ncbi:stage III sporulation protein AE [Clostridium neuense]|uniref:Stage III sporulation protein AE n=1 Tax=Clostridium neuense TaxID=1728934 RepID=A0ABW8TGB2_9CLOT
MKKVIYVLLIVTVIISMCQSTVEAKDKSNFSDDEQINQLYNYMSNVKDKYEILKDVDIATYVKEYIKNGSGGISFSKLLKAILSYSVRDIISSIKLISMLIIICIICALLTNFQKAFSSESVTNIAYFACYSVIIMIISKSFYTGVTLARGSIEDINNMMNVLIPALLALLAGSGSVIQSASLDPIILLSISISITIFKNILIPIIIMTFVLQFVNNLSKDYKIDQLAKLLNQIVMWIQGIVMTVFIGIVTIRGINSKAMDEITTKTAKFAVDNFVPIVGKCLSDAVSTVAGYSVLLKNAVGTIGLIILVVMMIFPVIKILILAFMHKLTAALVEPISDGRIVKCIANAGDTLILIASCLIGVSVMFFIMISIIIAAGKPL